MDEILENCIAAIAAGDKEALTRLYEETYAAVYGFALSFLKNPHDAEDVLQDVYVKIWETAGSYRPMGKPLAWIFTITRNYALMSIRRQNKTLPVDSEQWGNMSEKEDDLDPLDRLILNSIMKELSEDDQRIVFLHAVAGMKHKEIAELMDMSLSSVLSRYNRALKRLRRILEEDS